MLAGCYPVLNESLGFSQNLILEPRKIVKCTLASTIVCGGKWWMSLLPTIHLSMAIAYEDIFIDDEAADDGLPTDNDTPFF